MNAHGQHLTEEDLQRFVDGTAAEYRELQHHLEICPACGGALRRQKAFDRALRGAVPVAAPEHLASAILRQVRLARRFAATARIAAVASTMFVSFVVLGVIGAVVWMDASVRQEGGAFAPALRQAAAWWEAATAGVSSWLSPLVQAVLSVQQGLPTVLIICACVAGVGVVDLVVGRRLARGGRLVGSAR